MSLVTTLGTKIRAADSATSALDDLRTDLLASLPSTSGTLDSAAADKSKATTTAATAAPPTTAPAALSTTPAASLSTSSTTTASTSSSSSTAASASSSSSSPTTTTTTSSSNTPSSPTLSFGSLTDALPGPDDNDDHLSWELGMHSLTAELDSIRDHQNLQHQQLRHHHAQLIAADTSGLTPLPHNDSAAAAFHSAVIESYDRLSGGALGLRGKQAFQSRKLKARQGRAAKRAEEVYERQTTKLSKGRQKAKARRKAQY